MEPPTKVSPKTDKVSFAFAKSDLDFMALLDHKDKKVRSLVTARLNVKSTIRMSRAERMVDWANRFGTLPVPLKYWGAHTGRFSGLEGINLQNLPRGSALRYAIEAPPGYVMIVADASQIEARFNAWWSNQIDLVRAFADGEDVYSSFATRVFGYPVNKEDYPQERFAGKVGVLSLGYGAGKAKFAWMIEKDGVELIGYDTYEEMAESIVQTYRSSYGHIKKNWYKCDDLISPMVERGCNIKHGPVTFAEESIILPNQMRLKYNGLHWREDPDHWKGGQWWYRYGREWKTLYGAKIVENVSQACCRIVLTDAMLKVDAVPEWHVAMTVHDEVVALAPKQSGKDCLDFLISELSRVPKWAPGLPLAAEGNIGQTYGDAK